MPDVAQIVESWRTIANSDGRPLLTVHRDTLRQIMDVLDSPVIRRALALAVDTHPSTIRGQGWFTDDGEVVRFREDCRTLLDALGGLP